MGERVEPRIYIRTQMTPEVNIQSARPSVRVNPRAFNYLLISSVSGSAAQVGRNAVNKRANCTFGICTNCVDGMVCSLVFFYKFLCEEQWTLCSGMWLMVCSSTVTERVLQRAVYFAACRLFDCIHDTLSLWETQTCRCGFDDARDRCLATIMPNADLISM